MRVDDMLLVSEGREAIRNGRLSNALARRGLKQADLALVLDASQASVSRWCRGIRTPERDTAIRIAKLLRTLEGQAP